MNDVIQRDRKVGPDGTITETVTMSLGGDTKLRPVRDEVVSAVDAALGRFGLVMHAMDPSRLVSFLDGGPPIWSVGIVEVGGDTPYTLLVTYGLSHVLSPEDFRRGIAHEYSLALPAGTPLSPWADAFLRHQCRYVLSQRADIRVGDCVPFRGVPMTRIPFQPAHHARMPDSTLVGIVATEDPVVPRIDTPAGPIEVRRLVGIDAAELDRVETWSVPGFVEELRSINPLLLSPIQRSSAMDYPPFAEKVNARAAREGSTMDAAVFELSWRPEGSGVLFALPTGRAAARLSAGIRGRLGFGRNLAAFSMQGPPTIFDPAQPPSVTPGPRGVVIGGGLNGPAGLLLAALERGERSVRL
ncbi:MAG: suppressor of fused domain protein [Sandaracinus sp.]|nr:suppressor of fused domain protein [Sandaracinus sp.]